MKAPEINQHLKNALECRLLPEEAYQSLCLSLESVFIKEPNCLKLSGSFIVVGDIHGQFFDMIQIFRIHGYPPKTKYLFLGDYVDRGLHSIETIGLLFLLKLRHPDSIYLLRGNHECRSISQNYGFQAESQKKFKNTKVWGHFTRCFDGLPIAAVLNGKVFAVHGGLSPELEKIEDIDKISRVGELGEVSVARDICWGDPDEKVDGFRASPR